MLKTNNDITPLVESIVNNIIYKPTGITIDNNNNIYTCSSNFINGNRIGYIYRTLKNKKSIVYTTSEFGLINNPLYLTVDNNDELFVSSTHEIQHISKTGEIKLFL